MFPENPYEHVLQKYPDDVFHCEFFMWLKLQLSSLQIDMIS